MSRYRPPRPKPSPYITAQGCQRLRDELYTLRYKQRPNITQALSEAAAEGDRSENAEYIYRKKQLREMDRRIGYLMKRLDELVVVAEKPADQQRVFFGASVMLRGEDSKEYQYRLVGSDEFDIDQGHISIDAPLARALLKQRCNDEVKVTTPKGQTTYYIMDIRYDL